MRYHNFILTLWQDGAPQANAPPAWRYSLEYPSTGERYGFKHTDELLRFINQWTVGPAPADCLSRNDTTQIHLPTFERFIIQEKLSMPMSINRTAQRGSVLAPGGGERVGAVGVAITFKTVGAQSGGQFLALEYVAPPHFSGPPLHWHKVTTEIFYVVAGALTFTIDGEVTTVGPGGYAFVPPGTVHGFANQSDAPAKYFGIASPAGLEDYFAELQELIKQEPAWPPRDMGKLVALMAKYDTFAPPVQ